MRFANFSPFASVLFGTSQVRAFVAPTGPDASGYRRLVPGVAPTGSRLYRRLAIGAARALALQCIAYFALATICRAAQTYELGALELQSLTQDWGEPHANKSVDGRDLSIGGRKFERGLGTHAVSTFRLNLNGTGERCGKAIPSKRSYTTRQRFGSSADCQSAIQPTTSRRYVVGT